MTTLLGCIADDLTGATDLASMLVKHGMRTVQWIGAPGSRDSAIDAPAAIVALKSRTAPVGTATIESVRALDWLRNNGAQQFFFKYCSTFDSTDQGNIGPVMDALLEALGEDFTICCPAFPANRRTVYQGHLFVGDVPLSESGMRHHPLTPMTDSNLVRLLGRQTKGRVGLIPYTVVDRGSEAIRSAINESRLAGVRYAIVDALTDAHLLSIGEACSGLKLITGGSGVALGLPENFRRQGLMNCEITATAIPPATGLSAVIAGSCSPATLAQVEVMRQNCPAYMVDALDLAKGINVAAQAVDWAVPRLEQGPVLIYSSAPPELVAQVQRDIGRNEVGALIERALADIARGMVDAGVRRLIVAGGETAGSVMEGLGITHLQIGPEIDPGVPWTFSPAAPSLWLALKSGNFGGRDFFAKAFARLP